MKTTENILSKSTLLLGPTEINSALEKLATELNIDQKDKSPIFLCVLVGAIIPLGQLLPKLKFALEVNYIPASRYGDHEVGSQINYIAAPSCSLENRNIVIFDDILDGGITLAAIIKYCKDHGAANVKTAVLLDKPSTRMKDGLPKADFTGATIGNHWLYGFGLDYHGYWRNTDSIYTLNK